MSISISTLKNITKNVKYGTSMPRAQATLKPGRGLTAEYPATLKLYAKLGGYADITHGNWILCSCNILQNALSYMQNSKFLRKASYKYYIHRSLKHGTETSKDCDQGIRQISTCALDPLPACLVSGCIDVLLPSITKMINLSLTSGHFPAEWKMALVLPLLKKPGLDPILKNYRPISNLQFVSKISGKICI